MTWILFDSTLTEREQLPRKFEVHFDSINVGPEYKTRVVIDGKQIGDIIDDNSRQNDGYRFHDVFHYTFAAMLGWSPCTRAMMKRKRKSNAVLDTMEDGARALITEEAISLLIFSQAKRIDYYRSEKKVDEMLLRQIKEMTDPFEVSVRSVEDWEIAILTGYDLFRQLVANNGGKIGFDLRERRAVYSS